MLSTWLCASAYGVGARSFDTKLKPNMMGRIAWAYMGMTYVPSRTRAEGVFYDTNETLLENASFNGYADNNNPHVIGFDASKDDATYGGDKVQMSALQCLCCIKV